MMETLNFKFAYFLDHLMEHYSTGERGEWERAQDLSDTAGKVLRIYPDGRIPRDNPWVGQGGNIEVGKENRIGGRKGRSTGNTAPEIYAYGHWNIQGMAVHPETGKIWVHEHGPRGGDEINILTPRANYGWPVITCLREYLGRIQIGEGTHREGMEQPSYSGLPRLPLLG